MIYIFILLEVIYLLLVVILTNYFTIIFLGSLRFFYLMKYFYVLVSVQEKEDVILSSTI